MAAQLQYRNKKEKAMGEGGNLLRQVTNCLFLPSLLDVGIGYAQLKRSNVAVVCRTTPDTGARAMSTASLGEVKKKSWMMRSIGR